MYTSSGETGRQAQHNSAGGFFMRNTISTGKGKTLRQRIAASRPLYLLLAPSFIILFLFTYIPMYGAVIAFKDFSPALGILKSPWAGMKYFVQFFHSYQFGLVIRNTLTISLYSLLVTFPLPIIMALMCNQITNQVYKKFFQVSTYLPHFISTVVMCGMIILFLSPSVGIISRIAALFGKTIPNLMGSAKAFPSIYVWTEAWQHTGWDSILYIAALSAVDPSLYEAATMDGATKWQKVLHVDIPMLIPTAVVMFILRTGSIMSVGFEKVYLLQNTLNSSTSEIISTYVYKIGLKSSQYSLSSAIGLFNNVINLILLLIVNWISSRLTENSLV